MFYNDFENRNNIYSTTLDVNFFDDVFEVQKRDGVVYIYYGGDISNCLAGYHAAVCKLPEELKPLHQILVLSFPDAKVQLILDENVISFYNYSGNITNPKSCRYNFSYLAKNP